MNPTAKIDRAAGAPAPDPAGDEEILHRWETLFADEPELILAVLEDEDSSAVPHAAGVVLQAARRAVNRCPRYADLHYFAAHAALRARQRPEAARLLERAIELNPRYNDALILAARVAHAQQHPLRTLEYLRQALANGADYPDVHLLLGHAWRDTGAADQARRAYTRALALNANLTAAREALVALAREDETEGDDELSA